MFSRRLSPLSKKSLIAGQPVIFPVYNKHGQLLIDKGAIVTEQNLQTLENVEEIFTLVKEFETASSRKNEKEKDSAYHLPSPQKRLESIEEMLSEVYVNPQHPTAKSKILTATNRLKMICEKSPDASIAKIILDDNTNYTVRHSVHTAILSCLTAMHLEWDDEQVTTLISAALTMNISMGFMQDILVTQEEPLTAEQRQKVEEHPTESALLLKEMGVQNNPWIEFVAKHHECIDGTGYPAGLSQDDIPMGALIIGLSDVYCAKVSGRSYRQPIFTNVAVRDIYLVKDQRSRGTLIEVFVKILGLYPPGCLVKLQSNELGLVIKRGKRVDAPVV
ncbi:MAG: HD domain-containing phosphohydrolase, partial [Gammaproteobacteria bacterium]|nr:HD domain-containing phosphohydrolase [Gammaproteobacteria bacterium]